MVAEVGVGRFSLQFRVAFPLFRRLLKPALNLLDPTPDLQSAAGFAESETLKYLNLLYLLYE